MPELPEMQALSERLHLVLTGMTLRRAELLGFSSLKTYAPTPESLYHQRLVSVSRRAKYLVWKFEDGTRIVLHLSQAGRLDIEYPPKKTKPRGAAVRFVFGRGEDGPEGRASESWYVSTGPSERPRGGCWPPVMTVPFLDSAPNREVTLSPRSSSRATPDAD